MVLEENVMKKIDRALHAGEYNQLVDQLNYHRANQRQFSGDLEKLNTQYQGVKNSPQGNDIQNEINIAQYKLNDTNANLDMYKDIGRKGLNLTVPEYRENKAKAQGIKVGGLTGLAAGGLAGLTAGQHIFGESVTFRSRYIEENNSYSKEEIVKASGGDLTYTDDPKETFLNSFHPSKGDSVDMADLRHRSRVLDIDPDFMERNLAIRIPDGSGYMVDNSKLAGYMSKEKPDDISFGNTVGNGKNFAFGTGAGALVGGGILGLKGLIASGAADGFDPSEMDWKIPAGLGAAGAVGGGALGATLGTLGRYSGYKSGRHLHDRLEREKKLKESSKNDI